MNRGGIIRIIEASAAILIIFIVVLTFSMTRKASTEKDLSERITPLLEEIAKNNSMREVIISTNLSIDAEKKAAIDMIKTFLLSRVPEGIEKDANVCDVRAVCGMSGIPKEIVGNVYAGSRIISSSLHDDSSKRISIFLWFTK